MSTAHEPLRPVILNEEGEALIGFSPQPGQQTLQHKDSLFAKSRHSGECIGITKRIAISDTHAVIHCPLCGLRVPIPVSLQTYHDLRRYFPEYNCPAAASVHRYSETPPLPNTAQEDADGALTPYRHISTKDKEAYEDSYRPATYDH